MLNENIDNSMSNYINSTNESPNVYLDSDDNSNYSEQHNIIVNSDLTNDNIEDNTLCLICMDDNKTDNLILNKTYIRYSECNCEYYIHHMCYRKWLAIKYTPNTNIIKCLICRSNVYLKENCCNRCLNYCCKNFYYCFNARCIFYMITSSLVLLILMSSDVNIFYN